MHKFVTRKIIFLVLSLATIPICFATTKFNPFTGKPDYTSADRSGARTYYASKILGVVLDADPAANTGTDNTTALQAVLDGGDVDLIIDGPCMVDTLFLESSTTVEGIGSGMLFRKPAPNGGRTMITNKNYVVGPTAPTDRHIILKILYIDGNRGYYGSGNTGSNPSFTSAFFRAILNDNGYGVNGIGFYGVRYLTIENVIVYNPPAYGLNLGNVQDAVINKFAKYKKPLDDQPTDTIIQLQGYCRRISAQNVTGTALDDALAVNANDGQDNPGGTYGPYPNSGGPGPISDISFKDCHFPDGVMQICRFISANVTSSITNVDFNNITATLGSDGYGYAGFFFDDFGITGPLTDGTHGWMDGIRISNVEVDGLETGAGDGFHPVHFGACKIGRVEIHGFRAKTNGSPIPSVIYSGTSATVDSLVLRDIVNQLWIAGSPAVWLKGAHRSIDVDGLEFDQALNLGLPYQWTSSHDASFYPTSAIQIEGAVDRLYVHGVKAAGIAHVVKLIGHSPKTMVVGGISHWVSKGGAVVQSDTVVPRMTMYGLDADDPYKVPTGSTVTTDGSGWLRTTTATLRDDFFIGSTGQILGGHVSESGAAWNLDVLGADKIKTDGQGFIYLGGGTSINTVDANGQPTSENFDVEFDIRRLSALGAGEQLHVFVFDDAALVNDFYGFCIDGTSLSIRHNNSGSIQTTSSLPAVGVVWRIRLQVRSSGNNRTIKTDYSTDGGRTWAVLLADAAFTTTTTRRMTIYAQTAGTGWTNTTGHQIGGLLLRSY